MQAESTYSTVDFWLAAYLRVRGLKLVDVKKENNRSVFIFEDRDSREGYIKDFYNNALIEVGSLKTAVQDLKSLIHSL
jgi:hypothetical protein